MTGLRKLGGTAKATPPQAVVPFEEMVSLIQRAKSLVEVHLEYYHLESMSLSDRRDRFAECLEEDALREARKVSAYKTEDWAALDSNINIRRAAGYTRKLLSDQSKELLDAANLLRSFRRSELVILDKAITAFVISERVTDGGGRDDGAEKSITYLVHWLKSRTFTCRYCGKLFVSVASLQGGRPRRTCSGACKQAVFRQRQRMDIQFRGQPD
jgi:hypothetical protein